jgi:5,5'-dehydrodivanillate O-demethylase oxygenase subunit
MLTQEENDRLCRVGPGMPMGELMRRYWHPIAGESELDEDPVKKVRILGEDLVLYRDKGGRLGLLGEQCPHRKASLEYGMPEEEGLRCCYHGWLYAADGRCLDQPAEPPESNFKSRILHKAYPVEALGGLVFAYMGPQPAPLLPRYDVFAWDNAWRDVGMVEVPCNWLQCMENSVDLTHVDYLHGMYFDYVLQKQGHPIRGRNRAFDGARHVKMGFDVFEHGIVKRRIVEGGDENSETWREGSNPILFPNMTRAGGRGSLQIRVPIDDEHTLNVMYSCYRPDDGKPVPPQEHVPVYRTPLTEPNGKFKTDWVTGQDIMVWATQGPIMDRSDEKLGASDQGIMFYRKVLQEQIDVMESGDDPLAVIRDPSRNVLIEIKREPGPAGDASSMDHHWQQFSPIYHEAKQLMERSWDGKPRRGARED